MPDYDHFLLKDDTPRINTVHTILKGEDAEWLKRECNRFTRQLGYRVNVRGSADNALRLFLMADKGYSLDRALDLSNLKEAELKELFSEFFEKYCDPSKKPEENLRAIGDMHRRAFEKISDYRFPDLSQIRTPQQMYNVQAFLSMLANMITDYTQDTKVMKAPQLAAYYEGAGGDRFICRTVTACDAVARDFNAVIARLEHPNYDYPSDLKANLLYRVRGQLMKLSGKSIGETDSTLLLSENSAINSLLQQSYDGMYDPGDVRLHSGTKMEPYNRYLSGETDNLPQNNNIVNMNRQIEAETQENVSSMLGRQKKRLGNGFKEKAVSKYQDSLPHPDEEEVADLLTLPDDVQSKLKQAYYGMFSMNLDDYSRSVANEIGYDEFDLIRTRDNESIRELVNRKYPGADEKTQYSAMIMESVRQAMTGGIRLWDIRHSRPGELNAEGNPIQPGTIVLDTEDVFLGMTDADHQALESDKLEAGLLATRETRVELFSDPTGRMVDSADSLTADRLQQAEAIFDRIYGPVLHSYNAKRYRNLNSEKSDVDFFHVGGMPLRDYLGEERLNLLSQNGGRLLKAEILRMTTDPAIPVNISPVGYDQRNNTYNLREQIGILDIADKKRIQIEFPYLDSIDTYKTWAAREYKLNSPDQLSNDKWNQLYQWEFHQKAAAGLHRANRVLTVQQYTNLSEDPEIPHALTFEGVKTIYGPKPCIVEGWLGEDEKAVYTRDDFIKFMNDLPQGTFSDGEFALVAYLSASSPEVVKKDLMPAVPNEWMSQADKLHCRATMWTTDFMVRYPIPRENLGNNFFEGAIKPSREAASEMIAEFDGGHPERLADRVSEGLAFQMQSLEMLDVIGNPQGAAAQHLYIIRKTADMLEERPELKTAVLGKMTPEEKENLTALLNLEEVMTSYTRALARRDEAERNGGELSGPEKEEAERSIFAFQTYATRWNEYHKEFERSPGYRQLESEGSALMVERSMTMAVPGEGPGMAFTAETDLYKMKYKGIEAETKQSLLSDDPYRIGESLRYNVVRAEEFYRDRWQRYEDAVKTENAVRNENYAGEISPEECDDAASEREICIQHLERFKELVESRLSPTQTDRIKAAYNLIASGKGWPTIDTYNNDRANQSPIRYPERFKALFDIVMEEVRRTPSTAYKIEEELEKIKAPTELPEQEKLVYPLNPAINGIRTANPGLSDEDSRLLERVSADLEEIKPVVKESLVKINNKKYGDFLREENVLRSIPGYSGADKEFSGLLQKKEYPGSRLSVRVMTENGREEVRRILSEAPQISGGLLEKGIGTIRMMEERNMLDPEDEMPDGSRIFSHHQSAKAKAQLAAEVSRANLAGIRQAEEKYRLAHENEKAVFDHVKNNFTEDSGIPYGMDSLPERSVASEFSTDPATDSRMNALYKVGITAKKLNIPVEEYIKNPGQYLLIDVQQKLSQKGFDSKTKPGDDFATSMQKLYSEGQRLSARDNMKRLVLDSRDGETFVKEAIGNLYSLETDPAKKKEMLGYQKKLGQLIDAAVERENAACVCIYHTLKPGTEADEKSVQALKDGLKLAFLQGGGIRKEHLTVPYTDAAGEETERPADYREMLSKPNAYAELTQLYRSNLKAVKNTGLNDTKLIVQEALLDYLAAHPEDRAKKEYKDLEKLAFAAERDLGITPPANAAEATKRPKARYEQRKNEFDTELRDLENAVVRADMEINNKIQRLQRQVNDEINGEKPDKNASWDKIEQIEALVQVRQIQLIDQWQKHEITDSYFRTRYDDLQELLINPGARAKNPPKFTDKNNPEQYARDLALVNNRLDYSLGNRKYKSLKGIPDWVTERKAAAGQSIGQRRAQRAAAQNQVVDQNMAVNNNAPNNNNVLNNQNASKSNKAPKGPDPIKK